MLKISKEKLENWLEILNINYKELELVIDMLKGIIKDSWMVHLEESLERNNEVIKEIHQFLTNK